MKLDSCIITSEDNPNSKIFFFFKLNYQIIHAVYCKFAQYVYLNHIFGWTLASYKDFMLVWSILLNKAVYDSSALICICSFLIHWSRVMLFLIPRFQ